VVTEDDRGLRTLRFDATGVRQSVVNPSDPDYLELAYARSFRWDWRWLISRSGSWSWAWRWDHSALSADSHYPTLVIDAVDIDPEVVSVAKQFFGFREDSASTPTWRTAGPTSRKLSLVRHRLPRRFSADSIPYHLATREFLVAVRRALTPQGLWSATSGAATRTSFTTPWSAPTRRFSSRCMSWISPRPATRSCWPCRGPAAWNEDVLARRASEISTQRGFRFDLGEAFVWIPSPGDDGARGKV